MTVQSTFTSFQVAQFSPLHDQIYHRPRWGLVRQRPPAPEPFPETAGTAPDRFRSFASWPSRSNRFVGEALADDAGERDICAQSHDRPASQVSDKATLQIIVTLGIALLRV